MEPLSSSAVRASLEVADASGEDDLLFRRGRFELADTHVVKHVPGSSTCRGGTAPDRTLALERHGLAAASCKTSSIFSKSTWSTRPRTNAASASSRASGSSRTGSVNQGAREVRVCSQDGEVVGEALNRVLEHEQRVFAATAR